MLPLAHRQGTILIIVAAISALMASLALTFLVRMRSDVQESETLMREAQAHIMLMAACHYIQEASRLGYDDSTTEYHKEAYGWIDIRDGAVGPKPTALSTRSIDPSNPHLLTDPNLPDPNLSHGKDYDKFFPQQTAKRFDMYLKQIPPYAIRLDPAPNAIDPTSGVPWLVEPDPKPQVASSFTQFEQGDPTPRQDSTGRAWFRLLRCGSGSNPNLARYNAATFIVTCGSGETHGFRRWSDMSPADHQIFANDQVMFESLQSTEIRLWYLVEWSPAVGGLHQFNLVHHRGPTTDSTNDNYTFNQYSQFPPNHSFYSHSQTKERNFGGTIRYVQRLTSEPPEW